MLRRSWSVKFRGREVQNPIARVLLMSLLMLVVTVVIILVVALIIVLSPVAFVTHFILRIFGRRGFVERSQGGLNVKVSLDGFRKTA